MVFEKTLWTVADNFFYDPALAVDYKGGRNACVHLVSIHHTHVCHYNSIGHFVFLHEFLGFNLLTERMRFDLIYRGNYFVVNDEIH